MTKRCSRCKKIKSLRLFYRDIQKSDGLMSHCKDCERRKRLEYYKKGGDKKLREYTHRWNLKNKQKEREKSCERYKNAKQEITKLLGGKCNRCGFTDKRVLQVDHINGGGNRHFKIKGSVYSTYKEIAESIKKNEGKYQLLCANCNLIEAYEKGYRKTIWK